MTKLAMLGWGPESQEIYDLIQNELKHIHLVGISSSDDHVIQRFRASSEVKLAERDYHVILGFHDLDGVIMTAGADRSVDMVHAALEGGSHLLLSNPIATNVSDAMTIKAKADQYTTQYVSVAMPRRYDANVQLIKSILHRKLIGDISSVQVYATYPYLPPSNTNGRYLAAGLYMDHISDEVDLIHYLTGARFEEVHARGSIRRYPALEKQRDIDTAIVNGQLTNLVQVVINAVVTDIPAPAFRIIIEAKDGRIEATDAAWSREVLVQDRRAVTIFRSPNAYSPYRQILQSFSHAIQYKKSPEDFLMDSVDNIRTSVAMAKSDILKEEVTIQY